MFRTTSYHLVDNSPWPIVGSFGFFFLVSFFFFFFQKMGFFLFPIMFLLLLSFFWWQDVIRESTFLSFHMKKVQKNLLSGMVWFISSEVFFFFGFFWTFFHSSLTPTVELFMVWPPTGIQVLNPMSVPLLNTMVLLSSGITVTWGHYSLFIKDFKGACLGMILTIILSIFFTTLQYMEYVDSSFVFSDSVYSSIFFMATGFHGFHVLVGTLFLLVSFIRLYKGHFNAQQHVGLECSIWYWHFVDVVWIFLYISIYWWGST